MKTNKNFWTTTALVAGLMLAPTATAFAQDEAVATDQTTTRVNGDDGDNSGLWGLLGLIGLVGLAGLRGRDRHHDVHTAHTTTVPRT